MLRNPTFTLVSREACKASIMIEGLTGKGKSGLALMLAYGLEGGFSEGPPENAWQKIFAIDAENRSLNLFVGIPGSWGENFGQFYGYQLSSLEGYAPSNYLTLREAAVKMGAGTVIKDSITHMWTAQGGVLDLVNKAKADNPRLDNYRVWGTPEVSSEKQKLIDTIRSYDCHVITTVRVKEKFDMQYDEAKKANAVVSLGEQQLQQDGLKYEPDLVLKMVSPGSGNPGSERHPKATVIKSRYAILSEGEDYVFTPELCDQLRAYLAVGVDVTDLLEMQRQDYIKAVTEVLDSNSGAKAIWATLKQDAGVADQQLVDIPLPVLKGLYSQIANN